MHDSMRYRTPEVRQHLASHYVLGTQTARVRRRTESLINADPQLQAEVWFWQSKLARVNSAIEPQTPPASVWHSIVAQLDGKGTAQPGVWQRLWQRFPIWQATTALLAIVLAVQLFVPQPEPLKVGVGADYVALMDSDDADLAPELIVAAYLSKGTEPSRLAFEWNDRSPRSDINGLTLFAIDKDTGAVTNLGTIADDSPPMLMSKVQWKALKNSSELVIAEGDTIDDKPRYRGPCIQIARTS